jgi:hypothetical protein
MHGNLAGLGESDCMQSTACQIDVAELLLLLEEQNLQEGGVSAQAPSSNIRKPSRSPL